MACHPQINVQTPPVLRPPIDEGSPSSNGCGDRRYPVAQVVSRFAWTNVGEEHTEREAC
jgi:hypothetical protein